MHSSIRTPGLLDSGTLTGLYGHPHHALILRWFDPTAYLLCNPDVAAIVRAGGEWEAAEFHFVNTGFGEKRAYRPQLLRGFDADFYRSQVGPSHQTATNDVLAGHWLYEGLFAGLAASETTDAALRSDVHVFNMGRVGSHALIHGLIAAGLSDIIHTHSTYEFGQSYEGSALTYDQLVAVKALETHRAPITFFSGVRDPFEWFLSAVGRAINRVGLSSPEDPAALHALFRERVGHALHWFDHQYFQGVDVYAHAFDAERGFGILTKGRTRVVLYRSDKLESLAPDIADTLGLPALAFERINSSRETRPSVPLMLPEPLWDAINGSRFLQHFFTAREREMMRATRVSARTPDEYAVNPADDRLAAEFAEHVRGEALTDRSLDQMMPSSRPTFAKTSSAN